MSFPLELIMLSLCLLLFFFVMVICPTAKSKLTERQAPEVDGALPIIGHLHLFGGGNQLLHRTLGTVADKYGPTFSIRLGIRRALVVSSWEVAKECFTVNDRALASRPKTSAHKHMYYNNKVFGLGPDTPFWRAMKKISIQEFLSNRRLEMLKDIRLSEINSGINDLYGRWEKYSHGPVIVELNQWLEHIMLNIIVIMVSGKRYFGVGGGGDEAARFQKAIFNFFRLSGVSLVSDVIPFLGWLDLHGYKKQMKMTANDLDLVLGEWLDEHRQKRKLDSHGNESDFIDVMLSLEEKGLLPGITEDDSDNIIKATCLGMIVGGNTTAATVNWAISLLLTHTGVLKKLQQEIDEVVGKERQVEESDIKDLVFLEAIIKETLRLYPAGPLLAPREAREDCRVAGYNVKAGTRLIVNVWKLQRDERVWSDPSKFQPERFLGSKHKHIDLRGHNQFVLVPFGSGRRSCPASTFALLEIHLTLARLLHSFNLGLPGGLLAVDMTEAPGMTNPKKKPLEVVLTPRLPSKIYAC